MRGIGRVYKRGGVWWVEYWHRGKQHRESSHSASQARARKLLKQRLGEINAGRFIGPSEDRLTFEQMVTDLENDYRANGKRSLSTALNSVQHLKGVFGLSRAIDITPDRVKSYQVQRLGEGASRASVNREVACVGRMLSLAVDAGKLARKPKFPMLDGERVREGFLEHGEFLLLLSNLPSYIKPIVEFLYLSGWRKGEAQKLEWKDADLEGQTLRLRIENSKNKESRVLPLAERLWELIQDSAKDRRLNCPYVFHHNGKRIGDFRKAWKTACIDAGLGKMEQQEDASLKYVGTIPHDLRRCAARNLSRAGVSEQVAMGLTGHKTNSMYRRYRIVDERDLREATQRLQMHLKEHLKEQPKTSVIVPILIKPNRAAR